jgi:hypothetical protein
MELRKREEDNAHGDVQNTENAEKGPNIRKL